LTRRFVAVALLSAAVIGLFTGMGLGVLDSQAPSGLTASGLGLQVETERPTASPTPTPAPTPAEGPPRDRTYVVTNNLTKLAADVEGASDDEGAAVILFQVNGGGNQQWRLRDAGSGAVALVGVDSGNCLQVANGSGDDGAPMEMADCTGDADQAWRFDFLENVQGWRLTSARSGLVLDAEDRQGTRLVQRAADATQRSQVWFFTPLG
jgi:hypothetical protein